MSLFFFSSRRRHTRLQGDWSSDVCSSDLFAPTCLAGIPTRRKRSPRNRTLEILEGLWFQKTAAAPGAHQVHGAEAAKINRSEERRVGKECRSRWSPYH